MFWFSITRLSVLGYRFFGVFGMEVQPPLDRAALVLSGHATVAQQQEQHLGVRAVLDLIH